MLVLAQETAEKAIDKTGDVATEMINSGREVSEMAFLIVIVLIGLLGVMIVTQTAAWLNNKELSHSQAESNRANARHLPIMEDSLQRLTLCHEQQLATTKEQGVQLESLADKQRVHHECTLAGLEVAIKHAPEHIATELKPIARKMKDAPH